MNPTARRHAMPEIKLPDLPVGLVMAASTRGIPNALLRAQEYRQSARGLLDIRAQADDGPDAAAAIRELKAGVDGFKAKFEDRMKNLEAAADADSLRAAGERLNGIGGDIAVDKEYTASFDIYARAAAPAAEAALRTANATGRRADIQAAMNVGDNSAGGYLAPVEWDRNIHKAQRAKSPMRRISRVVTTGRAGYTTLWNDAQWGSGWVGETASRPGTSTPTLQPITFKPGEIYANPAASQTMLDDSAVDLEAWLSAELADVFDKQEGIAFISGDGANKPFGLLQYVPGGAAAAQHPGGTLDVVASGNATTIPTPDVLMDFKYGLLAPYRQNATWLMNSQTANAIAKMKDTTGAFVWKEGLAEDQPTTLLGRPVEIDENMPNIGAGALPIAFGDFSAGYVINDRIGIRVLRDPYTAKPFVTFYTTKRVGAGVIDPRAIRLLKVAAS